MALKNPKVNGHDHGGVAKATPPVDQPKTLAGLLFDPLHKTDNYAMVILAEFIPELGHGFYGIVNRDTRVVEATSREYGASLQSLNKLQESYDYVVKCDGKVPQQDVD